MLNPHNTIHHAHVNTYADINDYDSINTYYGGGNEGVESL